MKQSRDQKKTVPDSVYEYPAVLFGVIEKRLSLLIRFGLMIFAALIS